MSAIPPTTSLANLAASSRGATPVHVENVAPEIARLSAGTILSGTVISRDAGGAVHIRTDHGALVIRTPMSLPEGATVKIQLQVTGNQTRAVVLSVEARPGNAQSAPPPAPGPAADASAASPQTRAPVVPTFGTESAVAAPPRQALRPGTIVTAQIIEPPATGPGPGTATANAPTPAATAGVPPSAAAAASLTLKIVEVIPPASPAGSAPVSETTPPVPPSPARAQGAPITGTTGAPAPTGGASASQMTVGQQEPPPPPSSTTAVRPPVETTRAAPSTASTAAQPANPGPAPASGHPRQVPLPAGAPQAASGASPGASAAPAAQMVSGTVMGAPGAQTYLATPIGRLVIPAAATLAPNSVVRFEIVPGHAAPSGAAIGAPSPSISSAIELAREWPALRELTQTLSAANPVLATRISDSLIPQAGPRLAQTTLFFINALRLGDMSSWLGARTAGELRAAIGRDFFSKIGEEFQQLSRLSSESSQSEWRAYLVPFHDGDRLQQMRFFHRRYGGEQGEDADGHGDRFLIDLDLSRLGPMQLDGLLQAKRFSLILRTDAPLDEQSRQDLRDLFTDGCACAGLAGEVSFAGARDFIALPLDPVAGPANPLTA